jgi:predicted short-subunit dehydrogenase-like oxidoreductase (DUF2520 family)
MVDPAPDSLAVDCPIYTGLQDLSQAVDLLLICVPDSDISGVLQELTQHPVLRHATALHLSGASNLSPYDRLEQHSFSGIGMLHPLYSFPQPATVLPEGLLYGINGDKAGIAAARELCQLLQGRTIVITQESRALYHVLAAIMSNFPQALATLTAELTGDVTADANEQLLLREGLQALLLQSVAGQSVADPGAELTGPARRGDVDTLRVHLQELRGRDENLMDLYLRFSQIILHLYDEEIPASRLTECRQLLEEYKNR